VRTILQICRRELKYFFVSPRGYLVMTAFLFLQGWIFVLIVSALSNRQQPAPVGSIMQVFLGQNIFFWIFLLLVLPITTMGLVAEERRSGTIELLLTAPVTEGQVILGKFLGAYLFYVILWVPTFLYPALLARATTIDPWPLVSGYLYLFAVGAPFVALGVLASALSRNQITAAILTSTLIFLVFALPVFLQSKVQSDAMRSSLVYINLWDPAGDFGRGIVDTRLLVYTMTAAVLLLIAAARTLELKKAR